MADLDDFFAKKDRKRSKGKPVKVVDISAAIGIEEQPAPQKSTSKTTTNNSNQNDQPQEHEDEWMDFKVEEQRDYTGLKIQQLVISEKGEQSENSEGTSDTEKVKVEEAQAAWKAVAPTTPAPAAPVREVKEETKNVYVSPGLRNAGLLSGRPRPKTSAPDLNSADYFPALGAAPKPDAPARGGLQPPSDPRKQQGLRQMVSNPVTLGNRFNTLDTEDS